MLARATACAVVATTLAGAGLASAAGGASQGHETCAHQGEASFPGAYTSSRNLVIGPLVLVGGRTFTPPETVQRFGGQKYPALLAAGHTARIAISTRARRTSAVAYGGSAWATRRLDDGHRAVTFHRCSRREAKSDAGGRAVTFWSGGFLTSGPRCLHLKAWIDGARRARHARIPLGRRC